MPFQPVLTEFNHCVDEQWNNVKATAAVEKLLGTREDQGWNSGSQQHDASGGGTAALLPLALCSWLCPHTTKIRVPPFSASTWKAINERKQLKQQKQQSSTVSCNNCATFQLCR